MNLLLLLMMTACDLRSDAGAEACDCTDPTCETVCVESCDDGVDDDGDGFID